MTLCPCSFIRTVSSLLRPAHITYYGPRGKQDSIHRKISSYGFKTHRHHQMRGENGTIYLVTSLRAVSNEQSTLKICFFFSFLLKEQVFYIFMSVSKKPMLSECGTLCTGESTWSAFASHMTIPYTTAIFPKRKRSLWMQVLFCSQSLQKLITQGSCSFTWLKILQPITTVTF